MPLIPGSSTEILNISAIPMVFSGMDVSVNISEFPAIAAFLFIRFGGSIMEKHGRKN
jgi:hypothetical protein